MGYALLVAIVTVPVSRETCGPDCGEFVTMDRPCGRELLGGKELTVVQLGEEGQRKAGK